MNYGSCAACNKMIRYDKLRLCDDCKNKFLSIVKDYIYENGIHTASEIHQATGVPIRVIEYFLNNGYFKTVDISNYNKSDLSDQEALKQMALLEELKNSFNHEEPKEVKAEMRFMNRDKVR